MPSSRMPDFFIVGAPKCGTTALYEYLASHPYVFMPKTKDPHFFCEDMVGSRHAADLKDYLALFSDAGPDQIVGEASVWYLFSEVAISKIFALRPDAKFIVMLRDPVEV